MFFFVRSYKYVNVVTLEILPIISPVSVKKWEWRKKNGTFIFARVVNTSYTGII